MDELSADAHPRMVTWFSTHPSTQPNRQVKGRIWRDGQRRPCVLYRLLVTGSIEEKMFMRQMSKSELHVTLLEDSQVG